MENPSRFKNRYRIDSIRCKSWDYASSGYYFVTICTKGKRNYFGKIRNGKMELNGLGKIAEKFWREIPDHFDFVTLDEFVIMPNHMHGILVFDKDDGVNCKIAETRHRQTGQCPVSTTNPAPTTSPVSVINANGRGFQNTGEKTLSSVIGSYKSICSKNIGKYKKDFAWHGNFYDRIIRNEKELEKIRRYVYENTANWRKDENFM